MGLLKETYMLTKQEFILQHPELIESEQDVAYQTYCDQYVIDNPVLSPFQRILTAVNNDWSLIAELHPMITSDFKKEFEAAVTEEITVKIESGVVALVAKKAQDKLNEESMKYLAETDWVVIRSLDGIPVPQDIQEKRIAARAAIVR
jgi:hypothetical protein